MAKVRMHRDEVETSEALVRRLVREQFPRLAGLPVEEVASAGTVNAIYRLGEERVVRLPRIPWAGHRLELEREWLPRLAPRLPLEIPRPLAVGEPGEGYPWSWAIHGWIEGETPELDRVPDPCRTARSLGEFLRALREIETTGGPRADTGTSRGAPLVNRDAQVRETLGALGGRIDAGAALAAWEAALRAPGWGRPPAWFHGDMMPGNLLFERGALRAVIDFGGFGVGDPACDGMIAWGLLSGESREVFREAAGFDEATWARARGHALAQAAIYLPYYLATNPVGVRNAFHQLEAVLADPG